MRAPPRMRGRCRSHEPTTRRGLRRSSPDRLTDRETAAGPLGARRVTRGRVVCIVPLLLIVDTGPQDPNLDDGETEHDEEQQEGDRGRVSEPREFEEVLEDVH